MLAILASAVRVVEQARRGLSGGHGHCQGVEAELAVDAFAQRPTYHHTREQVEYGGDVEPALAGPNVGDVGDPDLIRCGRGEVTVEQVRGNWVRVLRVCRAPRPTTAARDEPTCAHDASNALVKFPRFRGHPQ